MMTHKERVFLLFLVPSLFGVVLFFFFFYRVIVQREDVTFCCCLVFQFSIFTLVVFVLSVKFTVLPFFFF